MRKNFLLTLLAGCCATCPASNDSLSAIQQEIADGRAVLVDVREQKEWEAGHLKSARLLPLSRLRSDPAAAVSLPKEKVIYVHCRSGQRAVTAANLLKQQGFNARPLSQSFSELSRKGL